MKHALYRVLSFPLCVLLLITLTSCEDDSYDHTPPDGQGSIIVDNSSDSDAEVFIDGRFIGVADSDEDTAFDFEPGRYRLVLTEVDGYRNYRDDIDVLENRLTVLKMTSDYAGASLYYVEVDFE